MEIRPKNLLEALGFDFKGLSEDERAMQQLLVEEYKKKTKEFWDDILKGPAVISDEEARAMEETISRIRKEYGFRDKKWH